MNIGGIQRQLINLISQIDRSKYDLYVLSFYEGGLLEYNLYKSDINYISLKKDKLSNLPFLIKFLKVVYGIKPDIIYSFFLYINFLTIFFRLFKFNIKIIWGIRGLYNPPKGLFNNIIIHSNLVFSKIIPDLIIANSKEGKDSFVRKGMQQNKIKVIWNGVDTKEFNSNLNFRKFYRNKMKYGNDQIIIGMVGRLHIDKNIDGFISAAKKTFEINSKCRFLIVGDGDVHLKNELNQMILDLNLNDIVKIVPPSDEISKVYNGMDIITSVSKTEGLQNSLLEAMACNKYCVASDVGDSKFILNEKSLLFSPYNDVDALIKSWLKVIELMNSRVIYEGRNHILKNFSIDLLVKKHEHCFQNLTN